MGNIEKEKENRLLIDKRIENKLLFIEKGSNCPMVDFLNSIENRKLKSKTIKNIYLLADLRNKARPPLSEYVKDGIFELRTKFSSNITRAFYFFIWGDKIIMTNGYVKKGQKLNQEEFNKAKKLMDEYLKVNANLKENKNNISTVSINDYLRNCLKDSEFRKYWEEDMKEKSKEQQEVKEDLEEPWYDDDWTIEDEDDIENYEEDDPITPEQEAFANELRALLQSLIDNEESMMNEDEDNLEEKFTSQQSLIKHFQKHCLASIPGRISTKNNIYYDFNNIKSYFKYEQKISNILKQGVSNAEKRYDFIDDIFNVNETNKKFTKLFEGNFTLFISGIFGLRNSSGIVNLGIHSFSSDVTTNYKGGNTIDICIMTQSPKTITLYPVDASTLKKELLRIFKKYSVLQLTPSKDNKKLLDSLSKDNEGVEYMNKLGIKSNGIYSINHGWLKHPIQQDIPNIDMDEFEKEFKVWEDKYFDLLDKLADKKTLEEDISNKKELVVYNATNESDYSHFNVSKELGIHCGTLKSAKEVFNGKEYNFLNKLTLNNYKIIDASKDYQEIWDALQIISHKDNLVSPFSKDELDTLINKCREIDFPNKYERRGKLFRDALLQKGYNLIRYKNEVEDIGSISYIILDDSIITNVENVEKK